MEQRQDKKRQEDRQRKFDEAQRFGEDRVQLLDTIHEMIDIELERRGLKSGDHPYPGNSPPGNRGREPPDSKSHCRSLWQRIVSFFSGCL